MTAKNSDEDVTAASAAADL